MLRNIFFLMLTAAVFVGCGPSEMVIPEKKGSIQIDGKLNDWDTGAFQPYENRKLFINASYDDQFIYLACKCTDRSIGRLFALNGIKIWIDPDGQKDQNLEMDIRYEDQRKFDFQKGNFFAALDSSQKSIVYKKLQKINNGILVIDKKTIESKVFYKDYDSSFDGKMLINGNDLNFELKIPININKYFKDFGDLKLNKSFIGIAIGRSSFSNFRAMHPGMGGGRNGSIIPRIPGGGGRSEIPEEPDPEIWIKLNTK